MDPCDWCSSYDFSCTGHPKGDCNSKPHDPRTAHDPRMALTLKDMVIPRPPGYEHKLESEKGVTP